MIKLPKFKNQKLFDLAFTHRSFLNEVKSSSVQHGEKTQSNERLEFLGDSILSFVVSNFLFATFPQFQEGTLTNIRSLIVNTKSLANTARTLEFGSLLKLSKGEEDSQGRDNQSLLADSFEAFIGALFVDQGLEAASAFIHKSLLEEIDKLIDLKVFKDPKSLLQEYVQGRKHLSPVYKVLHEEGPAHAKIFTVGVFINEILTGSGKGKSKQEAEEQAANIALEKIKK